MNKKSQSEEFIGIVVFVVVLVVIFLFTKIGQLDSATKSAQSTKDDKIALDISATSTSLPYVTVKGIPMEELMSIYNCYGTDTADYGVGKKINVTQEIRAKLDEIYGKENWAIYLLSAVKKGPFVYFYPDDSGSMKNYPYDTPLGYLSNINFVEAILSQIVGAGKYEIIYSSASYGSGTPALVHHTGMTGNYAGLTDMACTFGYGSQLWENWAGIARFIANNGNPVAPDSSVHQGWKTGERKFVIVSSDEESCGSEGPTQTMNYVNAAVPEIQTAGVKVYFIKPLDEYIGVYNSSISQCNNNIPFGCDGPLEYYDGIQKLTNDTGGAIINLGDDYEELAAQFSEIIGPVDAENVFLTSSLYEETKNLTYKENFISYDFTYPLPCNPKRVADGILYVNKEGNQ